MSQITVDMPPALQSRIDTRLAQGAYADAADYLRDLVRRDDGLAGSELEWLRAAVAEGDRSELIDREPDDLIEEIIREYPARDA